MAGNDSNTFLLLHCDGSAGSTTFPDSGLGPNCPHTVTAHNGAKILAAPKWGTGSLGLDGTNDYLSAPDSADWDICGSAPDSWTIDLWVKLADYTKNYYLVHQYENVNNRWQLISFTSGIAFSMVSGGVAIINTGGASPISDTDWHHIALIKIADEYGIYKDGAQILYLQDNSTDTLSGSLFIGTYGGLSGGFFYGNMDEIRIQHSNYFNANPVVGLTDTIVVPTGPYSAGWSNITKVNGINSSGIAKVNGIAVADIAKINGISV